jgi:hypothetical protein
MLDPCRLAYFAGLFDGEGCVGVYHQPKSRSSCLRVQIVQNLKPGVEEAFSELVIAFGGKIRHQRTRTANTKVCYDAAGDVGCAFLEAILPYVRWKREQVALGIAWHQHRPRRQRDARGRVVGRDEADVGFACIVAKISAELKTSTLAAIREAHPAWSEVIDQLVLS